MGDINNINQYAYFREFTHTKQFELLFNIDTVIPKLGHFKEEIKAVRGVADTVSSLLQHIKNKIFKLMKDKYSNEENEEVLNENFEITVSLKTNTRHLKGSMGLMAFRNNLLRDQFVIFKVFDEQYIVLPNAPLIKQMKLPPVLYMNSYIQPYKFSSLYTENQKSQFIWYKSEDRINWVEVGRGFGYLTRRSDVGFYLKLLCNPVSCVGIYGPPEETISETKVEIMGDLPVCPFERRHEYTQQHLTSKNE